MSLTCIPEWCAQEARGHDETCPLASLSITKAEFVGAAEGGARAAVETYRFLREDEGMEHDEAVEMVISEAHESAVCFVGVGSCGRGWCKHS